MRYARGIRSQWLALVAVGAVACGRGTIGDVSVADADVPTDAVAKPDARTIADAAPPADAPDCGGVEPGTWYPDQDLDGYGDQDGAVLACTQPAGYIAVGGDCDDGSDDVSPAATELCGDVHDNDCDGTDPCLASLLAHWPLDDGQGQAARDTSGHGHAGALRGNPSWGEIALGFSGNIADYVEVPHAPEFLLDEGTVALWFRASDLSVRRAVFSKDSSGNDTGGHLSIYVDGPADGNPQRLIVRLQDTALNHTVVSSSAIELDRWYHMVVTFGPDGMRLRLDGQLVDTDTYTGGTGATSGGAGNFEPIVLGAGNMTSGDLSATPVTAPHSGALRDVRIYDRALSAAELADVFELTKP